MTNRTRSASLWLVIAVALVAIAWKLVSKPTSASTPVEPSVAAAPVAATTFEPSAPTAAAETRAVAPPAQPEVAAALAIPIAVSEQAGTCTIQGFVRPAAGRVFGGNAVHVAWTDRLGRMSSTPAADDGAYSFAGVRPGRYWIAAGGSNVGSVRVELDVVGDHRLDLQLEPPRDLHVRIVDAQGKPTERGDLIAVATVEQPGPWMEDIVGSSNNRFGVGRYYQRFFPRETLPSDVAGRLVLDVLPPVFVSLVLYQYVVETQRVDLGQSVVTFVLEPSDPRVSKGKLRVRLIDGRTGELVEKGGIRIDGAASMFRGIEPGATQEIELEPGNYVMHVHAKDLADPSLSVRIEPGTVKDLGDLTLEGPLSITGRVVDPAGKGVATDVEFDACDEQGRPRPRVGGVFVVRSDADGAFRIGSIAAGFHRIRATREDSMRASAIVDARAGSVAGLELRLEPTVPLVVRFAEGAWENARLRIVDERGETRCDLRVYQREPLPIGLVAGSYVVEYWANPTAEPRRIPIVMGKVPLELALP